MHDELRLHYLTLSYAETAILLHPALRVWLRPGAGPILSARRDEIVYRSWKTHTESVAPRASFAAVMNQACNRALEALFPQAQTIQMSQLYDLIKFAGRDVTNTRPIALSLAKRSSPQIPRRLRKVLTDSIAVFDAAKEDAYADTQYRNIEGVLSDSLGSFNARLLLVRDTLHLDHVDVPHL